MTESQIHQRLAAVLAADAVGYTRLMQADERATVAALDKCRLIFRDHVDGEGGRVVDTAGDSVLAVFETATGAVRAAMAIQKALDIRNADEPDDRRMDFRIGVTLGEIIEKPDGTIYGDGVNIAARLEAEADPGGIVISGIAHDGVQGKVDAAFEDLGEHQVKNVAAPVRMYRVSAGTTAGPRRGRHLWMYVAVAVVVGLIVGGIGVWQAGKIDGETQMVAIEAPRASPSLPSGPSIAVLPLDNLSGDPEQDYFSDGLTEDVIAALGRFSTLTVLARNATLRFKGTDQPPTEIGRELGVDYLLAGSVRKAADRIRLNIQLTDAHSGVHLWSNRYDAEYEDLFDVQDEMTGEVVGTLAVELADVERARSATKPTENLEAYDYALRGWGLLPKADRASNSQARAYFERAIELDPNYADAYAGLGSAYEWAVGFGYVEFIVEALEQAEALAHKALELDPNNVRAHTLLGVIRTHNRDYNQAAVSLQRAIALNPSDAESYRDYGTVMLWSGHETAAIEWYEAARRIDPNVEPVILGGLGLAYYLTGDYQQAVEFAEQSVSRGPELYYTKAILAAAYAQNGQAENATAVAAEVRRLRPFFTVDWFAPMFADPEDVARLAEGLTKAGFDRARPD